MKPKADERRSKGALRDGVRARVGITFSVSPAFLAWTVVGLSVACQGPEATVASQGGSTSVGPEVPPPTTGADPTGTTADPTAEPAPGPGRVPLRRLNTLEYNNTIRDLFGVDVSLSDAFPPDERAAGFDNNASVQSLSDVHLEHYRRTVAEAVDAVFGTEVPPVWLVCDPVEGRQCAADILAEFLPRAYRRPTEASDLDGLLGLYDALAADGAAPDFALSTVLQAATLSPKFLFLLEFDAGPAGQSLRPLDGWELASRLSYFLWSSMPDDELFDTAASGTLQSEAELSREVERMLADEKAEALIDGFAAQWLPLRKFGGVNPDADLFPEFDQELRTAMAEETRQLVSAVLFGGSSARDLIQSDRTYLTPRLAEHYEIPSGGMTDAGWVEGTAAFGRGGILTQGAFLAAYSHPTETSPVLRGEWILSHLLCLEIPPPPPDVSPELTPVEGQSRRERLSAHRTNPACAACHGMMDPIGLALETYDVLGRYRETDNGVPIVVADMLPDGRAFADVSELSQLIVDDPRFGECLAKQLYVYALGRDVSEDAVDDEVLRGAGAVFAAEDLQIGSLVRQIVLSPTFRNRQTGDSP